MRVFECSTRVLERSSAPTLKQLHLGAQPCLSPGVPGHMAMDGDGPMEKKNPLFFVPVFCGPLRLIFIFFCSALACGCVDVRPGKFQVVGQACVYFFCGPACSFRVKPGYHPDICGLGYPSLVKHSSCSARLGLLMDWGIIPLDQAVLFGCLPK